MKRFHATILSLILFACSILSTSVVNAAAQWSITQTQFPGLLVSVSFSGDLSGWASGINTIVHTSDGGKTWTQRWKGDQAYWLNSIVALTPHSAIACGFPYGHQGAGIVLKTVDDGDTWTTSTPGSPESQYSSLVFRDDHLTGYMISSNDGLMKTVDAGTTWTRVTIPAPTPLAFIADHGNLSLPDDHTIVLGSGHRVMILSHDDGKTWDSHTLPDTALDPNQLFLWSRFVTPSHGYAFPLNGEAWETTDGGKTWARSNVPGIPYFQNAERGWAIAGNSVFMTVDGGLTWTDKTRATGPAPDYVALHAATATTKRLFVVGGDEGHGVSFIASRLLPGVTVDATGVVTPVTPKLHAPIAIHFHLNQPGYVTLAIDDASGKRVRNLVSETYFPAGNDVAWWDGLDDTGRVQTAANYNFIIDAKPVAAGKYLVRGLVRPKIDLHYLMTCYNPGKPPWASSDPSSNWLANHTPPCGVLFLPKSASDETPRPSETDGEVLVCSAVTEGGSGLAWLDLNGKKLYGQMWVGGVWTGASCLARDVGDNPVAGVYAYAGSAFAGGGYDGPKPALRLAELLAKDVRGSAPRDNRLGTGYDRPLLAPNAPYSGLLPTGQKTLKTGGEDYEYTFPDNDHVGIGGLAVRNALLVASLPKMNQLLWVDARTRKIIGTSPVDNPRGIAFDSKGGLLVLSGKTLVRYRTATGPQGLPAPEVLAATGLEDPQNLTLDDKGNIYISDWGNSNQVKVFSPDGRFIRAIGKPGLPQLGAYDPECMHKPNGMTIDSLGRLWVAETDYIPKRVSIWTTDGSFVKAFYGPMEYGGGGTINPHDRSQFFYDGMEMKIDWATGKSEPVDIYYLPGDDKLGLPSEFRGRAPETPITVHGRVYLTDCYSVNPTNGARNASLWILQNGVARPVAAMGDARGWKNPGLPSHDENSWFVWSDLNGDNIVQPGEVTFTKGNAGGVTVMPDLSFVIACADGKALQLEPVRIQPDGVPVYSVAASKVLAVDTRPPHTSGGGQALVGADGWTILTDPPAPYPIQASMAGVKDGMPLWSYPSLWPGLHPSHDAPMPNHPGELIGTTRLLGGMFTPRGSDVGPMWAINGNKGNVYIFTQDGLFVATLFQDCRSASWAYPQAIRGMSVDDASFGEEDFWPSLTQTEDGAIYIVGGGFGGNIISVDGLDKVRRLPTVQIAVKASDIEACRKYIVAAEAKRQQANPEPLIVAIRPEAPVVDGSLADWPDSSFVTIDKKVKAALAVSGDRLYAAFKTDKPNLIENAGNSPDLLFKTGGALDIKLDTIPGGERLLIARVKGKPMAMLYRMHVATGAMPVPFTSPSRTVTFDSVDDVTKSIVLASKGGDFEVSVPLSLLNLNPVAGTSVRGDIGVLIGNGFETLDRVYWRNKATGLTSDIPSEAELIPGLWGQLTFAK